MVFLPFLREQGGIEALLSGESSFGLFRISIVLFPGDFFFIRLPLGGYDFAGGNRGEPRLLLLGQTCK